MALFDFISSAANPAPQGVLASSVQEQRPNLLQRFGGALEQIGQLSPYGQESDLPAPVRTAQYFESLSPERQRLFLQSQGRGLKAVDLGDRVEWRDQFTNELIQTVPKGLSPSDDPAIRGEQAKADVLGKKTAEALTTANVDVSSLPERIQTIDDMLGIVGENPDGTPVYDLEKFQGFAKNFGTSASVPNVPGGRAATAKVFIKEFTGERFIDGVEALRGYGALSNAEGDAIREASTKLESTLDPQEAARQALTIRDMLKKAYIRAQGIQSGAIDPISGAAPQSSGGVKTFNPATGRIE